MTCDHFNVGDKNQRFEISVFDEAKGERVVVAWCDDIHYAAGIADGFELRPGWRDSEVLDRQPEKEK